jgi:hypothetical protein
MLLNKVVVGKGYKMTQDNTSLTAPPSGHDSVGASSLPFRTCLAVLGPRGGSEWRFAELRRACVLHK